MFEIIRMNSIQPKISSNVHIWGFKKKGYLSSPDRAVGVHQIKNSWEQLYDILLEMQHKVRSTMMMRQLSYRHSASASKCLECLWSMMTRS